MPKYEVNEAGVRNAEALIREGRVDSSKEWSEGQPTADEENRFIEENGYDAFGRWFLAIDPDAGRETKSHYAFPFGDFAKLSRDGLTSAKQRATQYVHDAIAKAADDLLAQLEDEQSA